MNSFDNNRPETDPLIVFIVPLKSKEVSKDWNLTCYLLEKTLCSILRQKDARFNILVVCHDIPDLPLNIKRYVKFIHVTYPSPNILSTRGQRGTDKLCKQAIGLKSLIGSDFTHYMFVDADDIVSNDISSLAFSDFDSHIQVLKNGYVFDEKSRDLWHVKGFSRMCGTCAVFRHDRELLCYMPSEIKIDDIFDDPRFFYKIRIYSLGRHNDWERKAHEFGKTISYVREPYSIYRWNYGDQTRSSFRISTSKNIRKHLPLVFSSGKRWQPVKMTSSIRQRFGIL